MKSQSFSILSCEVKTSSLWLLVPFIAIILSPTLSLPGTPSSLSIGRDLYLFFATSIAVLVLGGFSLLKKHSSYLGIQKLALLLLATYTLINFLFLSEHHLTDRSFVLTATYFLIFLYFSSNIFFTNVSFNVQLSLIATILFFESAYSVAQYFGWISSNSEYFRVTGSFFGSSQLGSFVTLSGVAVVCWNRLLVQQKKISKYSLIITLTLVFLTILLSKSRAGMVGFFFGLLCYAILSTSLWSWLKSLSGKVKLLGVVVPILLFIILGLKLSNLKSDSISGRLLIAEISTDLILEKPFFGHGLFSFDPVYNKAKVDFFSKNTDWDKVKVANQVSNPNNDFLLVTQELGVFGLFICVALLGIFLSSLRLTDQSKIALAVLIAGLSMGLFTSIIAVPSTMIIALWSLATLSNHAKKNSKPFKMVSIPFSLLLIFLGSGLLFTTNKRYKEWKLFKHKVLDQAITEVKSNQIMAITDLIQDNKIVSMALGRTLLNEKNYPEALAQLTTAFEHTTSSDVSNLLAVCFKESKDWKNLEKQMRFNVLNEPFKFKPRFRLMNFYHTRGQNDLALQIAKSIVSLPVKIPSPEVSGYKKKASFYINKFDKKIN